MLIKVRWFFSAGLRVKENALYLYFTSIQSLKNIRIISNKKDRQKNWQDSKSVQIKVEPENRAKWLIPNKKNKTTIQGKTR